MSTKKRKTKTIPKELKESQIWNKDKIEKIREVIISESKKQSPERKLRNEMLSIKYKIQQYIEKDRTEKEMRIVDFVRLYLKTLNITQKDFASIVGMTDANLYKYLTGERKLNPDLAMKLSSFSHTQPEVWYYIQTKNQLFELKKEKKKIEKYKKYDYEKLTLSHSQ